MGKLQELALAVEPEMVELWKQLHKNPELSMKEYKTAGRLEELLRKNTGAGRIERIGETGIWVELVGTAPWQGGEQILALRGDMDALPIQEETGLPYASAVQGVMHACGHDVHTASLLGAVRVLENYRDRIPGRIWFFFQPGEEQMAGARTFLADKRIDFSRLKAIAGIHAAGDLEVGKVRLKAGPVLASSDLVRLRVTGEEGHAAFPHKTRDPIVAAANLIVQLQTIVSREISAIDPAVLSLGRIYGGTKDNIIAREVCIEGTLRTLNKETRTRIQEAIRRISGGISLSLRVKVDVDIEEGALPLINDAGLVETARKGLIKAFGENNVAFAEAPGMAGEDFSYFTDKMPGVFIFVGVKSEGGKPAAGHTAEFYTDPRSIRNGILTLSAFALEYFGVNPD
ncbi:MAG: amidohydrolase [Spirochaetaceae bacterium]|nr:amidohydrolase [Spirochaetaceae bacterium]